MTRTFIAQEIQKLQDRLQTEPTGPWAAGRQRRLAELQVQLAALPAEQDQHEDPKLTRWLELQRRAEAAQRATERRGY